MKKQWGALALSALSASIGCAVQTEDLGTKSQEAKPVAPPTDIDVRRSLAVTEQSILERFSLERVMNHLAAQAEGAGVTGTILFQQLWDTQNPAPGLFAGPHCNTGDEPALGETLNGFPYICREAPSEGYQASCDPFAEGSDCAYIPIGLFSRFDLAPANGAHCGEYRITFAKASGVTENDQRNLLIFEAVMPNPLPHLGLKGCQNIVKTWAKLTDEDDIEKRADVLEDFYFEGSGLIPPAMHIDHLGASAAGTGQLRTNQFIFADSASGNTGWMLREFKLAKSCDEETCSSLLFVPVTTKGNAAADLFSPISSDPRAEAFRQDFPTRVGSLLGATISGLSLSVPDEFNMAQSPASGPFVSQLDYRAAHGLYGTPLSDAVEPHLVGTGLTMTHVLERARTQTCAGCHRRSRDADLGGGLFWPADLGFVHISERVTEVVDGETRYDLSEALKEHFLPAREKIMEDFMDDKPRPPQADPTTPLIGHRHHG